MKINLKKLLSVTALGALMIVPVACGKKEEPANNANANANTTMEEPANNANAKNEEMPAEGEEAKNNMPAEGEESTNANANAEEAANAEKK